MNSDYFLNKFRKAGVDVRITLDQEAVTIEARVKNSDRYEYYRTKASEILTAFTMLENKLLGIGGEK